jgi:hypothetical protein
MAEFASKGLANGVGIPALVLGSLGFLGSANNGNGGILGGLFGGGNCNQVSALMAENANLRAEKYSDNKDAEVYVASRAENKALRDELMGFIRPLSNEAAQNRERIAVLEANVAKNAEIADLREKLIRSELGGRIDSVAQTCGCGIAQLNNAVASLQNTVNGITQTIIPQSAICPPVMPRYNSYTAPTDTAPATQPVTGNIRVQRG